MILRNTIVALTCIAASVSTTHANPADYFGFGARAVGLGGAVTALANDFSANYYNPGGLSTRDDLELSLGYAAVSPSLTINDRDLGVDPATGVEGGIILRGKAWERTMALSIALHLPNERITRLRALPELQPRFALYDNHPQRLVLTTSAAFELIKDTLHIGAGLTYLSNTSGRLNVTGQVDLGDAAGTTMISAVDVNFEAVRYLSAGIVWTPAEQIRMGVSFRDQFDLSLDIGVVVNGDIILDGTTPDPTTLVEDARLEIVSQNSNLFSPRQLAFGFAWQEPAWTLSIDITWMQWSQFKSPTALLLTELDAGDLPLSIPPNPKPTAPRFHDIVIPRLGLEGRLYQDSYLTITGRCGFWWEKSPAPAQDYTTNFIDGDKYGAAAGFTLAFDGVTEVLPKTFYLDFAGQFIGMNKRYHLKANPADPVGDYISGGHFLGFSTNLRFDL